MADSFNDLLKKGIEAARAGNNDEARTHLAGALRQNPQSETAWLWLSGVVRTKEERIKVLQQVLKINPENEFAIKGLQALGVGEAEEEQKPPAPPRQPSEQAPPKPKPLGIPGTEPSPPPPVEEEEDDPFAELEAEMEQAEASEPDVDDFDEFDTLAPSVDPEPDTPLADPEPDTLPAESFTIDFETDLTQVAIYEEYDQSGEPVPYPSAGEIEEAKQEALDLLVPLDIAPPHKIEWVRADSEAASVSGKDVKRVSVMRTRRMMPYLIGGVVGLVVIVGAIIVISAAARGARERRLAEQLANQPTQPPATNTPAPTETVTPRPTRTPLPESFSLTVEPTLTLEGGRLPVDLEFANRVTPTPPYVLTPHGGSLLTTANEAFYEGNYRETIDLVRRARNDGETDIDGYFLEGVSLIRLNDPQEARDVFLTGLEQNPSFAPINAALGELYAQQGNIELAREQFQQAKQADPTYLPGYLGLAELEAQQGNFDVAFAQIEEARALGSQTRYDVRLLLTEARLNAEAGDRQRALALAKLARDIDPANEDVNTTLADIRLELGYYDTAIVDLETYLTDIFPSSAEAWAALGTAYEQVGRPADAQVAFTRALQIDEESVAGFIGRGQYRLDQRDFDGALEDFNTAVGLAPNNVEALAGRAAALTEVGRYEDALTDFERIFELTTEASPIEVLTDPELEADIQLALLYAETLNRIEGNAADVIQIASQVLNRELSPEQRATAFEIRALAYREEGNLNAARNDVENALAISESGRQHYIRGLILEDLELTDQALREYEWVLFWDTVYGFDFAEDAAERLDALSGAN